ncbi:MAG: hypothetical protein ACWA5P_07995 [bacterium]
MMKEILDYIKDKSIDLSEMGVSNFALLKNDALEPIKEFKKYNILLYGGELGNVEEIWYKSTDGKDIIHNLDYAKNFIEKYAKDDTYIEFVTEEDLYRLL